MFFLDKVYRGFNSNKQIGTSSNSRKLLIAMAFGSSLLSAGAAMGATINFAGTSNSGTITLDQADTNIIMGGAFNNNSGGLVEAIENVYFNLSLRNYSDGTLNNNSGANLHWYGQFAYLYNEGALNNATGADVYFGYFSRLLNSGTLTNTGTISNTQSVLRNESGGTFTNESGGVINNNNYATIESGGTFVNESGGIINNLNLISHYDGTFTNDGTIYLNGSSVIASYAPFYNSGVMNVNNSSALRSYASFSNSGELKLLGNGANLTIDSGTFDNNGLLYFQVLDREGTLTDLNASVDGYIDLDGSADTGLIEVRIDETESWAAGDIIEIITGDSAASFIDFDPSIFILRNLAGDLSWSGWEVSLAGDQIKLEATSTPTVVPIPEPSTYLLLGSILPIAQVARRRKKTA